MATSVTDSKIRHWIRLTKSDLREHGKLWIPLATLSCGLAASIAVLSVFLPLILHKLTSSGTLIGFAVSGEGIFGLAISLLIGPISDRTHTPLGRRRPYILAGLAIAAVGLALTPFMHNYWAVVGLVFAFYIGYYLISTPYRALAPDVLPQNQYGRAMGYGQFFRGIGFVVGLGVGAGLFWWWTPMPFIITAGVLLLTGFITISLVREPATVKSVLSLRQEFRELWRSWWGHSELRKCLAANFLFEFTLAGLRTFAVLFIMVGLGLPFYWAMIAVGIVTISNIVAAVIAGYAADHMGIRRVLYWSNLISGVAMIIPFFYTKLWLVFTVLPLFAFFGASTITLSFPLVMEIIPRGQRGAYSGLFELARGLGVVVGPIAVGAAIDIYSRYDHLHHGYPALWLVLSAATLLSVLILRWIGLKPDFAERDRVASRYAKANEAI
jgi:MFS family permease